MYVVQWILELWTKGAGYIFVEIEACSFSTTIVSFPLQVKFIDSNKQSVGSLRALQF